MPDHPAMNLPPANSWALLLGEVGRWCIWIAAAFAILSVALHLFGATKPKFISIGQKLLTLSAVGFWGALGALIALLVTKQYTFEYVFKHSDNAMPDVWYRVSAAWGGQEGSFLLWGCTSALFLALAAPKTGDYRRWFTIVGGVLLAGLGGILSYESPFRLVDFMGQQLSLPPDGSGLSPALLNYWMKIHPPTIFMGFGSLAVLFAWSIAALISGDLKTWHMPVRPWALVSMTLMGIGLVMGGFWAYETLGWGGFWMWDPVENASLVPWCLTAAFIHMLFVAIRSKRWLISTAIMGAMGFISFCYGTFMTRSGFLGDSSVHSFAQMDRSALQLLTGILVSALAVLIGVSVRASLRSKKDASERPAIEPISTWNLQQAYGYGTTLLAAIGLACAIGMSVPLIMSIRGQAPKVVEEPLYNRVMAYLFIPTVLLMAIGPFLSWRGLEPKALFTKLLNVLSISLGLLGVGMFMMLIIPQGMEVPKSAMSNFGFLQVPLVPWILTLSFVCLLGIVANLYRLLETWRTAREHAGAFLTHAGVIITVLGLIISKGMERKEQFDVQQGRPGLALGYAVTLESTGEDLFARENRLRFRFTGRNESFVAQPILFYTENGSQEPSPTVRPWIKHAPLHDKYVSVFPLVSEASDPFVLKPGGTIQFEDITVKYLELERSGTPGKAGAKFGPKLSLSSPEFGTEVITPTLMLTDHGLDRMPGEFADQYFVFANGMNAADQSVTLQFMYKRPVFPLEIYYKPMPGLVWWGAGIMTFGGFLAAWQRRRQIQKVRVLQPEQASGAEPEEIDATPATAQV